MKNALSCLQKHWWWTEILGKARIPLLLLGVGSWAAKEGGKKDQQQFCFQLVKSTLALNWGGSNRNPPPPTLPSKKLPCNTRKPEHICQMSEISRGWFALCVFLILGNKGPLFPREAGGRNLALWLTVVPLLRAAFSYISWYHPSQQQLMRQDTRQQPHRPWMPHTANTSPLLYSTLLATTAKIPINSRNRFPRQEK